MCGSDPRLRSARPAWFSAVAPSPYRRPALIVTAAFGVSTSIRRGRPATETRSPRESARRLNECPVPRARTRLLRATRCCSSGTDAGRWKRSAPNVTLPAQFVRFPVNSLLPSRPKPDRPKLTGQARSRTGRGRRRSWFSKRDTATHWPAAPGRREASGQLQTADSFVRRALPWDLEPADVLRLVRDDAHPVALVGAWAAGGAVIGSEPHLTRSPPQCLGDVLDSPSPGAARGARALDGDSAPWPEPSGESADAAFGGGWIGYLGYGLAGDLMDMPPARGVARLHPPYAAFVRLPGGDLASLSPELFLRRSGRTAASRPIKGTRRRSSLESRARAQRRELEHSAKDGAENVMIVDLVRNDLSRACVPGSVQVPRLLQAEAHPGVWHLVSDVSGTLGPDSGDGDLVRAAFPPGSVTGAPKMRAMEIIHELEATPREVYTGAVGYRSPVAGLELKVAIRPLEFWGDRVWLGAGGGIVADSRDDDEYSECLLKAAPLIRAVGARLAGEPGARAAAAPSRIGAPRIGAPPIGAAPIGAAPIGAAPIGAPPIDAPRIDDARTTLRARPAAPAGLPARAGLPAWTGSAAPGAAKKGAAKRGAVRRPARPSIVMVDNYDSFTYNLVHMLVCEGCQVEVVRNDEVSAAQVAAFGPAGIVISPGPCGPADAGISVDVVRACGSTTPLLGVCLGHQAVAAAFGARIVRAPRPVHGRTSAIVHDGRALFSGVPQRFEATRYHSLMVDTESLPVSLRVTARTLDGLPMALRHAAQPIEGMPFHPEAILTTHGTTIMRNFVQAVGRWRRDSSTTEPRPAARP